MPWPGFRERVRTSIDALLVSHRPDHAHEGRLHNATAYGLRANGMVAHRIVKDGRRMTKTEALSVISIVAPHANHRHGLLPDGSPKPYKGLKGDSNFCIEIIDDRLGKWESEVISTFEANQIARTEGVRRLRDPQRGLSGKRLIMRLFINDYVRLKVDNVVRIYRVATISSNGQIFMAEPHEANVDARNRDKNSGFSYVSKMAGSLRVASARRMTVSPIGEPRTLAAR